VGRGAGSAALLACALLFGVSPDFPDGLTPAELGYA
jgi:hypothetical protein